MRKMERSTFGRTPARVRRSQHEVTGQTALPEEQKGDESFHRRGRNGKGSFKGRSSMSADGRERRVMVQKYLRFHTITRRAV